MTFNKPPTGAKEGDLEAGGEDEPLLDGNGDPVQPNELSITCIQGKRLPIMDKNLFSSGGSSDPFVKIKIEGFDSQKTKPIRKELNPVWNEKLVFPGVEAHDVSIQVTVEDYNDISTSTFMGRISIPIEKFDDMKPHTDWYSLRAKNQEADGVDRGEVQLKIHWKYNVKVAEDKRAQQLAKENSLFGKMSSGFKAASAVVKGGLGVEGSDDEGEEVQDVSIVVVVVVVVVVGGSSSSSSSSSSSR